MMTPRKKNAKPLAYEQALQRLAALCSQSEHSSAEARRKALSWGLSDAEADKLVDYLIDEQYIDDARYCRAFAHDKLRYNHWGRFKIGQILHLQGLTQEDIRNALSSIDEEEYEKIITDVLQAKARQLGKEEPYARRIKLMRHAAGKGFEKGVIMDALAQMGDFGDEECDFFETDG